MKILWLSSIPFHAPRSGSRTGARCGASGAAHTPLWKGWRPRREQANHFSRDDVLCLGYSTYNNLAKVNLPATAVRNLPWCFNRVNTKPLQYSHETSTMLCHGSEQLFPERSGTDHLFRWDHAHFCHPAPGPVEHLFPSPLLFLSTCTPSGTTSPSPPYLAPPCFYISDDCIMAPKFHNFTCDWPDEFFVDVSDLLKYEMINDKNVCEFVPKKSVTVSIAKYVRIRTKFGTLFRWYGSSICFLFFIYQFYGIFWGLIHCSRWNTDHDQIDF